MIRKALLSLGLVGCVACVSGGAGSPSQPAKGEQALQSPGADSSTNPLATARFVPDPTSQILNRYNALAPTAKTDEEKALVKALKVLSDEPGCKWVGDWTRDIKAEVNQYCGAMAGKGGTPVMIAYNIPNRDCGSYSKGGAKGPEAYRSWISNFAAGITGHPVVILEPDALPHLTECLSPADQKIRLDLYLEAVRALKKAGAIVYIDAGHCHWQPAEVMSERLLKAGIKEADGFSLNVSNFQTTECNVEFGKKLSKLTGGKHFVIDTSRNGNGPKSDSAWCNPDGRALGLEPTTKTGEPLIDAYLWAKVPGESDGDCNGAPAAGSVYDKAALELVKNSKWGAERMSKLP